MSAAKQKGTRFESAIVAYLRANGWPYAERRAPSGVADKGDIAGVIGVVIEAKDRSRMELAAWVDEATEEANNARAHHGVVWHKRRGKASAGDAYVTMTGATYLALLRATGLGSA